VFHTSQPTPPPPTPHAPPAATQLAFLATTALRVSAATQALAARRAAARSAAPPAFGLAEGVEGALVGAGANGGAVVVEVERRRRSGRGVRVAFVLEWARGEGEGRVVLLGEYAGFGGAEGAPEEQERRQEVSFELGLTEKQRAVREGVVLPYFDAQGGEGPGEGGRILYDMSVEDDFDDEEDEI